MPERIIIFQTRDPYDFSNRKYLSDRATMKFIASAELIIESTAQIDSELLCRLGFREPGEKFWIMSGSPHFYLLSEPLPKAVIERCMMYDKGHGRGLVVCGYQDHAHAWRRRVDTLRAEKHAKLMARLQRAPAIRAWNYMASKISPHTDLKRQIKCLLTCWRQRCVGDYGYLEAIDIMEGKKEYWEAFHRRLQEARA